MSLMHCHSADFMFDCREVELIGGQRIGVCLMKPHLARAWEAGRNSAIMDYMGQKGGEPNPYKE